MSTKKKVSARREKFQWTKDRFKVLMNAWEFTPIKDLAVQLGCEVSQVQHGVNVLRNAGFHIPKKRKIGIYANLLQELAEELHVKLTPRAGAELKKKR